MPINLTKPGESVNLTKEAGGTLTKVQAGLGWTRRMDLDSYIVLLDSNNVVVDFVYFGNKKSKGIKHHGDDLTGGGRKDDPNEIIDIVLNNQDSRVKEILVGLAIYSGGSSLSQAGSAFANVKDLVTNKELVRYNIIKDFGNARDVIIGKFVANGTQSAWKFTAVGETSSDRFSEIQSRCKKGNTYQSGRGCTNSPRQASDNSGNDRPGFLGRLFGRS